MPEKLNRPALSPRELDILRLIVKGLSNQEISEALNITRGTVKWHVNIILRRLGVSDRTQAVVVAAQRGIVEIWSGPSCLDAGDHVDFDQRIPWDAARGRDGRAHRRLIAKAALENFVHFLVVFQVVQIHIALENLVH